MLKAKTIQTISFLKHVNLLQIGWQLSILTGIRTIYWKHDNLIDDAQKIHFCGIETLKTSVLIKNSPYDIWQFLLQHMQLIGKFYISHVSTVFLLTSTSKHDATCAMQRDIFWKVGSLCLTCKHDDGWYNYNQYILYDDAKVSYQDDHMRNSSTHSSILKCSYLSTREGIKFGLGGRSRTSLAEHWGAAIYCL